MVIVVVGVVAAGFGVLVRAVPEALRMGDPDVVSTGLVVGGAALSAFGAGAVRRHYGRFGGRVWTVAGFLVTAAAAIAIAVAADAAWLSPGGLLCIAIAAASVLGAAVTVAHGVVARRMSAPSGRTCPPPRPRRGRRLARPRRRRCRST